MDCGAEVPISVYIEPHSLRVRRHLEAIIAEHVRRDYGDGYTIRYDDRVIVTERADGRYVRLNAQAFAPQG